MSGERAKVFDETYRRYMEEIRSQDFLGKAVSLGVEVHGQSLVIPLYNDIYRVNDGRIESTGGQKLTPAVQVMICKYILTCPAVLPELDETLVTYREFKDAAPLVYNFTVNTNKTLESAFSGNAAGLRERGLRLGGREMSSDTYDISLEFHAFPRVPVILNFNDSDDLFPPACSVLYRASAAVFLDMECLAMTGTLLTGKLIAGDVKR